ncbi:MAG: glycosyltransferase family 39 protein [Planctomycetes bacterium]|nr:glycosyltransferase family 39 protein [Planctomycetota bacterium]
MLVTVAVRALWVAYVNVDPNDGRLNDSVFYHNAAHLLAIGEGYQDPWGRGISAQWPPAYPLALAPLYKLFGWHMVLAKGLGIAFAAATVVVTYLLGRRIFDRRAALLGAALLAFFPGQIYFATLVYAEAMFALVFMIILLLTLEWTILRSEARWWQVLVIGVLVGAAAPGSVRASTIRAARWGRAIDMAFLLGAAKGTITRAGGRCLKRECCQ